MKFSIAVLLAILPVFLMGSENEEAMIRDLQRSLMASCFHGTVAEHGDAQMEEEIRDFVSQGRSRDEVIDYYVSIFGERILASPRARGFNLAAWLIPAAVFLAGVGVLVTYLKQRSGKPESSYPPARTEKTPYDDIIERELEEME